MPANFTGSLAISGSLLITGSIQTTGGITISGSIASASYALSSSNASNAELLDNLDSTAFVFTSSYNVASSSLSTRVTKIEGNYATTGSNAFNGSQNITGSLTVSQAVIAQTLNVQQVTSSIVYSCGSNVFGCALTDVQQMTGSVRITGSLNTIGNACITSVCSPAFVGGTVSGTTVYGSTAICGGVVCGTSATFSSTVTANELKLTGDAAIQNTRTGGYIAIYGNTGGLYLGAYNAGANQNYMYISGSGNVGIGTTSPGVKLRIDSADADYATIIKNSNASGYGVQILTQGSGTNLAFQVRTNNTATDAFQVLDSGNVGIGTTSPVTYGTRNLDVNAGSGGSAYIVARANSNAGTAELAFDTNAGYLSTKSNHPFIFRTNDTERMRITSAGIACFACQICTASSVYSTTYYLPATAASLQTTDAGAYVSLFGATGGGGLAKVLILGTDNTERMRITCEGEVKIGTSSTSQHVFSPTANAPQYALYGGVGSNTIGNASNILLIDNVTAQSRQWAFQIDGSNQLGTWYYGGSWTKVGYQTTGGTWTNSDQRRKENIELLTYGLNEVIQLQPKKFNFKIDENKKPYMGFIAQDVLPIIPEAVQSDIDGEEQYYAMNYDNLVPVLVKAIQEQQCQICTQATIIHQLKTCLGMA